MKYKHDWDDACQRLTALWRGEPLDRPCIGVASPQPPTVQPLTPHDPEAQWLDPAVVKSLALQHITGTRWGGELVPSYLLMAGWVFCYGAAPHFDCKTIWHEPAHVDLEMDPVWRVDWEDPLISRYVALYQSVLALAGWDDFMVGRPCLLPACDLLVAVLGNERFLTALIEHPQWIERSIDGITRCQIEVYRKFEALAAGCHAFPWGNPGWMSFWGPDPYVSTQADVSCMLSPEMFDRFIAPEIEALGRTFGRVWYHLDGWRAVQHLPRLLQMPCVRVIQFIPEPDLPPNGPHWLGLYRTIQEAGRIVHISVAPEYVEPLVRALDRHLLCIETHAPSADAADDLLSCAVQWARR